MVRFDLRVGVPVAATAAAVEELHEPDAALDEPARGQALLAERFASPACRCRTAFALRRSLSRAAAFRERGLHLERELVGFDAARGGPGRRDNRCRRGEFSFPSRLRFGSCSSADIGRPAER